jgi:DNA-binding Xre family transcriptional regulator
MRQVGYRWHLRQLMATPGMFSTTNLLPHLAERGVELSAAQVYRLVTGTPQRLNLHTLAALCDILGCSPGRADVVLGRAATGGRALRCQGCLVRSPRGVAPADCQSPWRRSAAGHTPLRGMSSRVASACLHPGGVNGSPQ